MALLRLTQKRSDGVWFVDHRSSLYYDKYRYRARVYAVGIHQLYWIKSEQMLRERYKKNSKQFKNVELEKLVKFFIWMFPKRNNKDKVYGFRIESDIAAVFSNDLNLLKDLENIGYSVDYTEVVESIPYGVKYFVKEPKHKYRVHLKSKKVHAGFADKLREWINRYEGTNTVISPSNALKQWYTPELLNFTNPYVPNWNQNWRTRYSSSSFFIDYNDESTLTLFMLMFDGMVQRHYKLEKRPD